MVRSVVKYLDAAAWILEGFLEGNRAVQQPKYLGLAANSAAWVRTVAGCDLYVGVRKCKQTEQRIELYPFHPKYFRSNCNIQQNFTAVQHVDNDVRIAKSSLVDPLKCLNDF